MIEILKTLCKESDRFCTFCTLRSTEAISRSLLTCFHGFIGFGILISFLIEEFAAPHLGVLVEKFLSVCYDIVWWGFWVPDRILMIVSSAVSQLKASCRFISFRTLSCVLLLFMSPYLRSQEFWEALSIKRSFNICLPFSPEKLWVLLCTSSTASGKFCCNGLSTTFCCLCLAEAHSFILKNLSDCH